MATKIPPIRPKDAPFIKDLFTKHGTKDTFVTAVYKALDDYLKAVSAASSNYTKAINAAGKKLDSNLVKLKKQK